MAAIAVSRGLVSRVLYGKAGAELIAEDDALRISTQDGYRTLRINDLAALVACEAGRLWSTATVVTSDGRERLRGYRPDQLQDVVDAANAAIKSNFNDRYAHVDESSANRRGHPYLMKACRAHWRRSRGSLARPAALGGSMKRTNTPMLLASLLVLSLLALAAAGCDGFQAPDSGATDAAPDNCGTLPYTEPDTDTSAPGDGFADIHDNTIVMQDNRFVPGTLEVGVGEKVPFFNGDTTDHEIEVGTENLGSVSHGEVLEWTATEPGTYPLCLHHPFADDRGNHGAVGAQGRAA